MVRRLLVVAPALALLGACVADEPYRGRSHDRGIYQPGYSDGYRQGYNDRTRYGDRRDERYTRFRRGPDAEIPPGP